MTTRKDNLGPKRGGKGRHPRNRWGQTKEDHPGGGHDDYTPRRRSAKNPAAHSSNIFEWMLAPSQKKRARRYDKNTERMKKNLPYHKAGVAMKPDPGLTTRGPKYGNFKQKFSSKPKKKGLPTLNRPMLNKASSSGVGVSTNAATRQKQIAGLKKKRGGSATAPR